MSQAESPEDDSSELDMTPMIDVTFLLLIFFMVATKFKTKEGSLKSWLPKDRGMAAAPATPDTKEVRIVLLMSGEECVMKVNQRVYPTVIAYDGDSPDFAQLARDLEEIAEGYHNPDKPEGQPVIIDAKKKVPVKMVIRALNACKIAGISDVTYARAAQPIE